jgi:hypothetical protein
VDGVLEGQVDLGLEVAAPPGPGGAGPEATAATPPVASPEEVAQQIAEAAHVAAGVEADPAAVTEVVGLVAPEAARTTGAEVGETPGTGHGPDLVVLLALGGVAQHVVGGRDLLESLLGGLVARVGVGVVLLGQLAVGARDLLLGGVLPDSEGGVVVLLEPLPLGRHGLRWPPSPWPGAAPGP